MPGKEADMPWEWDKGKRVFRPPTDDEVRANLIAANERYQDQIDRARAALEETIADRDRLAAENAELRAGQQTAYENLVKVARRAKASAARVRELEAALTAFVEAEDINRQYDGTYDSPPGHVVAEMYERAAAMARAALADSGAAEQEA